MNVEMRNGLARVFPVIDHQPVASLSETRFLRGAAGNDQKMPKQSRILSCRGTYSCNHPLRDHQEMHRRLRIHISQDNGVSILVLDRGGNISRDNSFEQSHG